MGIRVLSGIIPKMIVFLNVWCAEIFILLRIISAFVMIRSTTDT